MAEKLLKFVSEIVFLKKYLNFAKPGVSLGINRSLQINDELFGPRSERAVDV